MSTLTLENVSLTLSQDFSLSNISLTANSGEVYSLVGANASGKSSLMQIISGQLINYSGKIYFNDNVVSEQFFKENVFFSSQNIQLFDNLSVAENIYFNNYKKFKLFPTKIINHTKMYSECKKIFEEFNIDINIYYHTKFLAHAHKQMINIIKAYVSDLPIIIFDEPTSILSDVERDIVGKVLKNLVAKDKIIFYVTHRIDEINRFSNQVSIINDGIITYTSEVSNLNSEELINKMFGKKLINKYPKIKTTLGDEVLRVEDLGYKNILSNINFSLQKGEILGVTGVMGAGKSVLANCLFGSIKHDKGNIFLNGVKSNFKNSLDAVTSGIALVPENTQENAIFETLDLVKNTSTSSLKRFEAHMVINNNHILETFEKYKMAFNIMPGNPTDNIDNYSGGNKQKVVIARWLMSHRKIFILNQPTRGIDIASKIDIYNSIVNMSSSGVSIIFISSDVEELIGICDRILVLSSSTISCDIPTCDATVEKISKYFCL